MTISEKLDELLQALDPLTPELMVRNANECESVWENVRQHRSHSRRATHRRLLFGTGSLAATVSMAAAVIVLVSGSAPVSAAAATLNAAARASRPAATLPLLAVGQYDYQNNVVNAQCAFYLPDLTTIVHYNSAATVQVWTNAMGDAETVSTPSSEGANGAGWATPSDESEWIVAGSPYNPCAPISTTNAQPANYTGGPVVSLGVDNISMPALTSDSIDSNDSNSVIENLPTDPNTLQMQLAQQFGPASLVAVGSNSGVQSTEFTLICNMLMSLPDASARLAPVFYEVLADLPGVVINGNYTDALGRVGSLLQQPASGGSVVINQTTGTLLETFQAIPKMASPSLPLGTYLDNEPLSSTTYGPISVVNGSGTEPNGS